MNGGGVGPVLVARGLTKTYKSGRAVDGLDLVVASGERVGLLGPNGAGKTTTLLMLLGAITPDAGTIELAGHRLPRGRSRAMRRVGFAAGYLPLPDRLRVREALGVFAGFYGVADERAAVHAGLERFRIAHLADRMCSELSSGQRTLVGIVKAVLHHPDLLVLDEPTASLDPDVALRVRAGPARGVPTTAPRSWSPVTTWPRWSACASGWCSWPAATSSPTAPPIRRRGGRTDTGARGRVPRTGRHRPRGPTGRPRCTRSLVGHEPVTEEHR